MMNPASNRMANAHAPGKHVELSWLMATLDGYLHGTALVSNCTDLRLPDIKRAARAVLAKDIIGSS